MVKSKGHRRIHRNVHHFVTSLGKYLDLRRMKLVKHEMNFIVYTLRGFSMGTDAATRFYRTQKGETRNNIKW